MFTRLRFMERNILVRMVVIALVFLLIGTGIGYLIAPGNVIGQRETVNIHREFAGEKITVLGYHVSTYDYMEEVVSEFEELTGIDVELEIVEEEVMRDKQVLDYTSHTGKYDIAVIGHWHLYEYAGAGFLEPLDDYIENKKDPEWMDAEAISQAAWEGTKYEGNIYFVPDYINYALTLYRQDVFETLGIDPSMLSTTEGLMSACSIIKESDIEITPYIARSSAESASVMSPLGWAWTYGAKMFNEDYYPQFTTPEFISAMEDWVTLLSDYSVPGITTMNWMDEMALLGQGDAAITVETHDFGPYIDFNDPTSPTNGKWGWAQPPKGPAGNYAQMFYLSGLAINADSKHKDAAWLFNQWFHDYSVQVGIVGRDFDFVDSKVLESSPFLSSGRYEYKAELPAAYEKLDVTYWPFIPEFHEVGVAFMEELNKAIIGEKTVQGAMQDANTRVHDIMESYGYYG